MLQSSCLQSNAEIMTFLRWMFLGRRVDRDVLCGLQAAICRVFQMLSQWLSVAFCLLGVCGPRSPLLCQWEFDGLLCDGARRWHRALPAGEWQAIKIWLVHFLQGAVLGLQSCLAGFGCCLAFPILGASMTLMESPCLEPQGPHEEDCGGDQKGRGFLLCLLSDGRWQHDAGFLILYPMPSSASFLKTI